MALPHGWRPRPRWSARTARRLLLAALALGQSACRDEPRTRTDVGTAPARSPAEVVDWRPGPPPVASYRWTVRLDASRHRIQGVGTITFDDPAPRGRKALWFHLYLNAFDGPDTLYGRLGSSSRRGGQNLHDRGWIRVKKMVARTLPGVDLWTGAARHSPGDPKDRTDIRVPLPPKLRGAGHLELDVEFEAQLPNVVARTGHAGSFHFAGQWFPKLAKRTPQGTWVHFPFHPHAEFFADFGTYDVTIDVPASMKVGATGARVETTEAGDRRRVRHRQAHVHDFAWTAWDAFEELEGTVGTVAVRVLYPPGKDALARRELAAVERALPHFEGRYGPYPYPVLTVVHPPEAAGEAGGMEYPTLITTGGDRWTAPLARATELVTIHELGHQWFYGLLASNERRDPFLDEGLNSYAEVDALDALYPHGAIVDLPGLSASLASVHRAIAAGRADHHPVASDAASFDSFSDYGTLVYSRTATILLTLSRVHGKARFRRAMRRYAAAVRFRHPTPKDLLTAVEGELGKEPKEQLEEALFRRGTIDLELARIYPARKQGDRWCTTVRVERHGTLVFPATIAAIDDAGESQEVLWDGRGRHRTQRFCSTSPIRRALVDPERRILLDENLLNNGAGGPLIAPRTTLLTGTVGQWASLLLGP